MPHALFIPWGVNNAQLLRESESIRLCETPRSLSEYILMFMNTIFVQLDHFIAMIPVILQINISHFKIMLSLPVTVRRIIINNYNLKLTHCGFSFLQFA